MLQKSGVLPFPWWMLVQYNAYRKIFLVFIFVFVFVFVLVFVYALHSKKLYMNSYPGEGFTRTPMMNIEILSLQ